MAVSHSAAFIWTLFIIGVMLTHGVGWMPYEQAVVMLLTAIGFGVWTGVVE